MIGGVSPAAYLYQNLGQNLAATMKVSVPVRPLLSSTMLFKHVIGVPARSGEESTPSYKVRILDNFIECLSRLDKNFNYQSQEAKKTDVEIDTLIASLGQRLRRAEGTLGHFSAGLRPESGSLVNHLV